METRIFYLSALLVPTAWAIACGGSDNPPANANASTGGSGTSTGGSGTSTGGSASGNGGSSTGNGGSSTGNGGALTGTGGRGIMLPMEPIVTDPTCPDMTFTVPTDAGTLPDGGTVMIPPGFFGDGGSTTLKGCCDQTGVCGIAIDRSFMFGGMDYKISLCATPSDIPPGSGFDAGATKSCTYVAP